MGNASVDSQMHDQEKEDSSYYVGSECKVEDYSTLDFVKSKVPKSAESRKSRRLILKLNKDEAHEILGQELFIRSWYHLGSRIPKQVISPDEKYLRHCVALILLSASKAVPLNPLGLRSDCLSLPQTLLDDYTMTVGSGGAAMSPAARWIAGSVMRSESMMNLLKSPFLIKLGDFDGDLNFDRLSTSYSDDCKLSTSLFHEPENKALAVSRCVHTSYTVGRTPSSVTSSMSMEADQFASSSSSSPFDHGGILRSLWNGGVLQFTFSVDGQKELYIAHGVKVGFPDNKSSNFVYVFHRKPDNLKGGTDLDSAYKEVVGVMRVSTSISLCPKNSRVRELEFVLSSSLQEDHEPGPQKSIQGDRRTRKLSKVAELLKGVPVKRSGPLKCISSNMSLDKNQYACSTFHLCDKANFLEHESPPNLELAAIVVKDHLHDDNAPEKEEVGGWGLKFLGKGRTRQDPSSSEAAPHSELCQQHMDVIVPAGIHGGPRTRNNGPSSLIERWKSGGQCDCGGWDVGCLLKLLHPRPRKEKGTLHPEARGEPFTLFAQGSEEGIPCMRMVTMLDGVYDIGFQSALSALQCFSIAIAVIHSRSPSLPPPNVQ
ncbi:hypothetical protein AKJ16_DCAP00217 [Drosera capensis]